MLQLMSPAGSPEAVIAAVQSGADIIHIGRALTAPDSLDSPSDERFIKALHYCRVRGCRSVYSLPVSLTDSNITETCRQAVFAVENGADAIMLHDPGLVRILRRLLPETPLWGDIRMGIADIGSVLAAADMGLSHVTLAPKLSLPEIAEICKVSPIEINVLVHGHLCPAQAGQCYLALLSGQAPDDGRGWCPESCRSRFDLGGRLDDYPLNTRDLCLLNHIPALEAAGVSCAVIEGHGRPAEYVARATELYSRAVHRHITPAPQEQQALERLFSPCGTTDAGFLPGTCPGDDIFSPPQPRAPRRRGELDAIRRSYMKSELRRVPLKFRAFIHPGLPAKFSAEDDCGNYAEHESHEPADLNRPGIGEKRIKTLLYQTVGTPYTGAEITCSVDERMDFPDEDVEAARRDLVAKISAMRRIPAPVVRGTLPPLPAEKAAHDEPILICQISRAEQLSEALADCCPAMLYVPAELLIERDDRLMPFLERSVPITAVLPKITNQASISRHIKLLNTLRDRGIYQLLGGSLAWLPLASRLHMQLRGDYGFNAANTHTMQLLADAGLQSATVSFTIPFEAIRAMPKVLDTEMIVYGRLPVMITDRCIIRRSAGRRACDKPVMLNSRDGRQYAVLREDGCSNAIYDTNKIFLAPQLSQCREAGLWGLRLLFTSENARECVEVLRRYQGLNDHIPSSPTLGLYKKPGKGTP